MTMPPQLTASIIVFPPPSSVFQFYPSISLFHSFFKGFPERFSPAWSFVIPAGYFCLVSQKRNLVEIKATLQNAQGEICSEATCQYFTFPKEKASEMFFRECSPVGPEVSLEDAINSLSQR
jgi:hypothetical protein